MLMTIFAILGGLLGPHLLKCVLEIIKYEWQLDTKFFLLPYILGALFGLVTIVLFVICYVFKDALMKLYEDYTN